MLAQGSMLDAILGSASRESGPECGVSDFVKSELKLLKCGGQGRS